MRRGKEKDLRRIMSRRGFVLAGAAVTMTGFLGARLYYLQVAQTSRYQRLSDRNQFDVRVVAPARGRPAPGHGSVDPVPTTPSRGRGRTSARAQPTRGRARLQRLRRHGVAPIASIDEGHVLALLRGRHEAGHQAVLGPVQPVVHAARRVQVIQQGLDGLDLLGGAVQHEAQHRAELAVVGVRVELGEVGLEAWQPSMQPAQPTHMSYSKRTRPCASRRIAEYSQDNMHCGVSQW